MVIPVWDAGDITGGASGTLSYRGLISGDKAILIHYPTLWSGGMLPVTVKVEPDLDMLRSTSISIPIEMTKSYNADFDGDEVVLIPLTSKKAVAECSAITSAVKKPFSNQLRKDNITSISPPNQEVIDVGVHYAELAIFELVVY